MESWLALALEGVSEVPAAASPSLALWELRGALRGTGVKFDGGGRVEWERQGSGQAGRWRFLVAAPPSAVLDLARGGVGSGDCGTVWHALCSDLEEELRRIERQSTAAARALEELARAVGLEGAKAQVDVWGRRRAWRTRSAGPSADQGFGRRIRLRGTQGSPEVAWTGPEDVDPPWMTRGHGRWREELAWRRHLSLGGPSRNDRSDYRGPIVLLPRAAGWWAHEMGHAALELPSREFVVRHGARIVDDPRSGPWPAGFDWDDAGNEASAAVLWDQSGSHRPAAQGRLRRTSVRHMARAALTSTRLDIPSRQRASDLDSLPHGIPIAASVRAGRYEPISGRIFLDVDEAYVIESGARLPIEGGLVVEMSADDAWRGVTPITATCLDRPEQAWCTRQGSMHAVMVGAPTIVLDPVHARRSVPGGF